MGNGQLDAAEGKVKAPTNVQRMRAFHPLGLKPALDLKIGDRLRAGALGNGDSVTHMISMPMGDEDIIGRHLLGTDVSQGIASQKRVDQQMRASGIDAKAGMAMIRNPHNRHGVTSQVESGCYVSGRRLGPRYEFQIGTSKERLDTSRAPIIP